MELHLSKKDFKLEWYSGTGAGGQSRNKNQYCCRITHIDSGLSAIGTESKSRIQNQKFAFQNLVQKLIGWYSLKKDNTKSENINTNVIRNYHAVRNEVLDKASGYKLSYKEVVLDGNISKMIEARKLAQVEK